jgi:glycosyltransferase involved in cell wall biosynthesis
MDDSEVREVSIPGLRQVASFERVLKLALFISRVDAKEDADLIVNPSERTEGVLACFLASIFCAKPWTAIFQPFAELLQPSHSIGPLNPLNILSHINQKKTAKKLSVLSRIGLCIDLLSLLKTAERSFILAVSYSVVEDFSFLNPRIKFVTITPGNGIDLSRFSDEISRNFRYHGVFFARLIPEKGLFDLIEIWESVVKELPNAKLAVCGIHENAAVIHKFLKNVADHNLKGNIDFLGQQEENRLLGIVKHSYLTVYPSYADSFSLVTLESLASGTPVVAYNIPAIRHNFGYCKAVFRCPTGDKKTMADAILCLLKRKKERNDLAFIARKFACPYNWTNVVKAEKETYFKVVERCRSKKN